MTSEIANRSLNVLKYSNKGATPSRMLFYETPTSRAARRIKAGKTNAKIAQFKLVKDK